MDHYYLKHIFDRDLSSVHKLENKQSVRINENLYLRDELADAFFMFAPNDGEIRIPTHNIILAGGSDVFKATEILRRFARKGGH